MSTEKDKDKRNGKTESEMTDRSLQAIISESEFIKPLKENVIPLLRFARIADMGKRGFSTRFYFNLLAEAEKLESFMDDYGARENKTWHHFAELVASIRNFAIAAFQLSHVIHRYADYHPDESPESGDEFIKQGSQAMLYMNSIVNALLEELLEEMRRLGMDIKADEIKYEPFKEIDRKFRLPRNLEIDKWKTSEQRIMRILESYRKIAVRMHRERFNKRVPPEDFEKLIPSRVNETKIRIIENTLHTLQSEYDTHIRKTDMESSNSDLAAFRAYISIPMHLMEMAHWLIHFYERHENEIHTDQSREKIAKLVDKNLVLGLVSRFAFYYAHKYVIAGKALSEKIMSSFVRKARVEISIPKPAGFHARPAYYVSLVVEEHGTDVFMWVNDRKFDARSVLDLLEAGGMVADLNLETVEFEGDERTLADLKLLAECNYCENEKIPKELNYIRVARNIMA